MEVTKAPLLCVNPDLLYKFFHQWELAQLQWLPCDHAQDGFDLHVVLLDSDESIPELSFSKLIILTENLDRDDLYLDHVLAVLPFNYSQKGLHHLILQFQKGSIEELKRKNNLLTILQKLNTFDDLKGLLEFVIESVNRLCNSQRASLFLADHENHELYSQVAMGMDGKEIRFPIGVGIAGTVAADLTTVVIQDAYADLRFNPSFDQKTGFRTQNILCMPMCNLEGKLIGVIQVLNKNTGDFAQEDIELLKLFNTLVALTIESVALMEKTQALNSELSFALRNNRLLLENVSDGFLLLNKECRIMTGYANSCETILFDYLAGRSLEDLNFLHIPFQGVDNESAEFLSGLGGWLELGWSRTSIEGWDEFTQGKKFRLGDKILNCSFRRVFEDERSVVAVLVTLQDISQSYQLREQMEKQAFESKLLLEMVQLITGLGRGTFRSSMASFQSVLEEVGKHLNSVTLDEGKVRLIFGEYHTLKGIFQNVGLKTLAEFCHEEEHFWAVALRNKERLQGSALLARVKSHGEFSKNFQMLEDMWFKLYPRSLNEPKTIKDGTEYIWNVEVHDTSHQMVSQTLKAEALLLAQKLQRKIVWRTPHRNLTVPENLWWIIKPALTHVLRNCLDHGFENKCDASQTGEVFFDYRVLDSGPVQFDIFEIKDNGKGIDRELLVKTAVERGIISNTQNLTDTEKLRLICTPGLSTRTQLSDLSGRGMGMDVVLEIVESKLGGKLQIESTLGEGSRFLFKIPRFD